MPRAKDNRKPIGTETCFKCGEQAEFLQVQRGKRVGELYRKGCECKPNQNAKPFEQLEWFNRMTRTQVDMIPFPYKSGAGVETPEEPEPKAAASPPKPVENSGGKPENSKRGVILGGLFLVGGIAAALMT